MEMMVKKAPVIMTDKAETFAIRSSVKGFNSAACFQHTESERRKRPLPICSGRCFRKQTWSSNSMHWELVCLERNHVVYKTDTKLEVVGKSLQAQVEPLSSQEFDLETRNHGREGRSRVFACVCVCMGGEGRGEGGGGTARNGCTPQNKQITWL